MKNITNINTKEFLEKFNKEYKFLYENDDNVAGYDEALTFGDKFLENPKNKNFVAEFVKYRGDFISSDREVVAFIFALSDYL